MLSIKNFPSNRKLFIRLVDFCKEMLLICKRQGVETVIYESLTVLSTLKTTE